MFVCEEINDDKTCNNDGCDRKKFGRNDYCRSHQSTINKGRILKPGPVGTRGERKSCSIAGCDYLVKAKTFCQYHAYRARKFGDPLLGPPIIVDKKIRDCSIEDCDRPSRTRGFCSQHYRRLRQHGDPNFGGPIKKRVTGKDVCILDGCSGPVIASGYCSKHYCRSTRFGDPLAATPREQKQQEKRVDNQGYVWIYSPGHPNCKQNNLWLLEHRFVMSEIIGRPLFDNENVHHINGVKSDNSGDNLELWVTTQPKGQRPKDLVSWAKEILLRYDNDNEIPALALAA